MNRRPSSVVVASPLRSYTAGRDRTEASGTTLAGLLADLDRRHPGIRFRMIDEQDRIRAHIKIFVAGDKAAGLDHPVPPGAEVLILTAISGG